MIWTENGWYCLTYLLPKYLLAMALMLAIMVAIEWCTEELSFREKWKRVRGGVWGVFLVVLTVVRAGGGVGGRGTVVGEWGLGGSASSGERGGSSVVGGGGRGRGRFAIGAGGGASMGRRLAVAVVMMGVGGGGWRGVEAAACTDAT
jgi:hypothetical protein